MRSSFLVFAMLFSMVLWTPLALASDPLTDCAADSFSNEVYGLWELDPNNTAVLASFGGKTRCEAQLMPSIKLGELVKRLESVAILMEGSREACAAKRNALRLSKVLSMSVTYDVEPGVISSAISNIKVEFVLMLDPVRLTALLNDKKLLKFTSYLAKLDDETLLEQLRQSENKDCGMGG